MMERR